MVVGSQSMMWQIKQTPKGCLIHGLQTFWKELLKKLGRATDKWNIKEDTEMQWRAMSKWGNDKQCYAVGVPSSFLALPFVGTCNWQLYLDGLSKKPRDLSRGAAMRQILEIDADLNRWHRLGSVIMQRCDAMVFLRKIGRLSLEDRSIFSTWAFGTCSKWGL